MLKVNTFLHVFVNSLLPLDTYYRKLHNTKFSFSAKYFVILVVLAAVLSISVLISKGTHGAGNISGLKASILETIDQYPQDLTIFIKDGQLMTNYDRPFILWFDYKNTPHPLLVVDERSSFDKIYEYDALFLVNGDGITTRDDNKLSIYRFRPTDTFTFTSQSALSLRQTVSRSFDLLPFVLIVAFPAAVLIYATFTLVGKIIYLALLSLVAYLVVAALKKSIRYKKVYQISLHASTLPILLESVILPLGPRLNIPLLPKLSHMLPKSPLTLFLILNLVFILTAIYETYLANRTVKRRLHVKTPRK